VYHHYAYPLGKTIAEPDLVADSVTDANGHILPYVRFEGGTLQIADDALAVLDAAAQMVRQTRRGDDADAT